MEVPCSFCSRRWALGVLCYRQKEMQLGIEMREHRASPKPTLGMAPGWGSSAHGGKAKGETVAWGELHPGPHSPSSEMGAQLRGGWVLQPLPIPQPRSSSPECCRFRACLASCCVTAA